MAKDYAKRVFTTSRKPKKKRQRVELFVIPIVLLALIAGYWGYSHKNNFSLAENFSLAHIKNLLNHKKGPAPKTVQTAKATNASPVSEDRDVHFDFYNELPKMQVTVPEEADATPPPPKPVVKVHQPDTDLEDKISSAVKSAAAEDIYVLQFGEFKNEIEASQTRVSLLLAGAEVKLAKVKTGKGMVYRVQSHRLATESEAKRLQKELEEKGIISEVKKA